MKRHIGFMFYFAAAMALFTQNCYAYIDPASTSYIIQIVAGILIACGTAVGIFWNKISRAFRKKKDADIKPEIDKTTGGAVNITADDLLDDEDKDQN